MVDSAGSPHASPYGGLVRYRRTQAGSPHASPYGVPGALPPDSAGSPHASPYGGLVHYRRTQRAHHVRAPTEAWCVTAGLRRARHMRAPTMASLSGEPLAACVICGIQIPWNRCGRCCRPGCRVPGGACPVPCSARCAGNGAGTGRHRSWSWRRGFRCGRR